MKAYLNYKKDIEGYTDVLVTVRAAEKIAASKIATFQKKILALNICKNYLSQTILRLQSFYQINHPLLKQNHIGKKALVIVSGNKGLAGDLYHLLIQSALQLKNNYDCYIVIGEKCRDYLAEERVDIYKCFAESDDKVTDYLLSEYALGNFITVDILYAKSLSLVKVDPAFINFLPFKFNSLDMQQSNDGLPIFGASKKQITNYLIDQYVKTSFLFVILESKLAENSMRIVSTEHAQQMTKLFIEKLKLSYFKDRRSVNTQKQLESFSVHKML